MLSWTASGCEHCYVERMTLQQTKALWAGVWASVMLILGMVVQPASMSSLTVLLLAAVIPPAVLWHLWNAPSASTSETINSILR